MSDTLGYESRVKKKTFAMSATNIANRYKWALKYSKKRMPFWNKVWFTDESK